MLHFFSANCSSLSTGSPPNPPTLHHPPPTSHSALWLSLLLSYLSSSSTVPSELCSMVCKFHRILNFLSEHCLYLPILTKIPFFTKDSTCIANDNGCLFFHTLDTLRLKMLWPLVLMLIWCVEYFKWVLCVLSHFICVPLCETLWTVAYPWDSLGKNTGVGCHALPLNEYKIE